MEKAIMEIKKKLELAEYISLVDSLAKEFFDDENNYSPHWGELNAVREFYNRCVKEDIAGLSHDISDASLIAGLLENKDFIRAFERCKDDYLEYGCTSRLTFGNAYATAKDIVNVKVQSFNYAVESLKIAANNFLKGIIDSLSPENIDKIEKIANQISNGELSAEAISEAVGNSEIFKKLIGEKKDDTA